MAGHLVVPPPHEKSKDYEAAIAWLHRFKPSGDEGYDKALAYAWKKYDEICSASEALDRKANNLVQSTGVVTGLLGFGITSLQLSHIGWTIPTFVLGVASIILAAVACSPSASPTSASVADLLDDITEGHKTDAWIAASLHCAIRGRDVTNNWKAARIRWATWILAIGLGWLVIVLLGSSGDFGRRNEQKRRDATVVSVRGHCQAPSPPLPHRPSRDD
jgi:hypothetical protein